MTKIQKCDCCGVHLDPLVQVFQLVKDSKLETFCSHTCRVTGRKSYPQSSIELCSICLDTLGLNVVTIPQCGHAYHGSCLASLRRSSSSQRCCVCRGALPLPAEELYSGALYKYKSFCKRRGSPKNLWPLISSREKNELKHIFDMLLDSAAQGYLMAIYKVGVQLLSGNDLVETSDAPQAVKFLHAAAVQGHAKAQSKLATLLTKGVGVLQDDAESSRWHEKAAEQGLASSQYLLSIMYDQGFGVPQSDVKAAEWCQKAALQRHAKAMTRLGSYHLDGRGVQKDDARAIAWYRRAVAERDPNAKLCLSFMYERGRGGLRRDPSKAQRLLVEAAQAGCEPAFALLDDLGPGTFLSDDAQDFLSELLSLPTVESELFVDSKPRTRSASSSVGSSTSFDTSADKTRVTRLKESTIRRWKY